MCTVMFHYRSYIEEKADEMKTEILKRQKQPRLLCCISSRPVGEIVDNARKQIICECSVCKRVTLK